MKTEEKIKLLKDKLYTKYGISFSEDDPAWLMTLINHDIINEALIAIEKIEESSNLSIENYQNIENISSKNLAKFKEVLQAINVLQINANKIQENVLAEANELDDKILVRYNELYNGIHSDINILTNSISEALMNISINTDSIEGVIQEELSKFKVDFSPISNLEEKINSYHDTFYNALDKKEEALKKETDDLVKNTEEIKQKVKNYHRKFDTIKKDLDQSILELDSKKEDINDAVSNFNGINKSVTTTMSMALICTGLVVGFGIATFFKIDVVSDYYFSQYDKKQEVMEKKQNELDDNIKVLQGLSKFLYDNNIEIGFNVYNDTNTPFLKFKKHQTYPEGSEYTFERAGNKFIGFKTKD